MNDALLTMARGELARCYRILLERQTKALLDPAVITIRIDIRARNLRGQARFADKLIRLNRGYYLGVGDAYRQTVAHEYAHHLAFIDGAYHRRERSHGLTWQRFMRLFGYDTARASAYDMTACAEYLPKPRQITVYHCECVGRFAVKVGDEVRRNVRAFRLRAGTTYTCPRCGIPSIKGSLV